MPLWRLEKAETYLCDFTVADTKEEAQRLLRCSASDLLSETTIRKLRGLVDALRSYTDFLEKRIEDTVAAYPELEE